MLKDATAIEQLNAAPKPIVAAASIALPIDTVDVFDATLFNVFVVERFTDVRNFASQNFVANHNVNRVVSPTN